MENYFQAEAFNLDKVLDEFEQNEGERLCQRGDRLKNSESLRKDTQNEAGLWD